MAEKLPKVTIKIPRPLYNRIRQIVENSGYDSPTDFIVHVLRDIVSSYGDSDGEFQPDQLEQVKERLRKLGYL
jgi:Arc/MetJ-type ribon-helix-helix transcriptional regulator